MTQQLIFSKEYAIAAAIKASSTGVFDDKSYNRLYRIFDKLKTHLVLAYATKDIYDNSFGRLVKEITKAENNPQVPELALLDSVTATYDLVEGSDLFKLVEASKVVFKTKLAEAIGNKNTKFTFYSIRNYVEAQQLDMEDFDVLHQVLETIIEAQNFVSRNKYEDLTDEQVDKISELIDDVKELDAKSKASKPPVVRENKNKDIWDKAEKKRGRPAKSKDTISHVLTEEEKVIAANKLNEKFHGSK